MSQPHAIVGGGLRGPLPRASRAPSPSPFQALALAYDLIASLSTVVAAVARHDRPLADQLRRAAQSVVLNLAECSGHSAGNRRLRVESAFGSVQEIKAALHIARCWGYADSAKVAEAYELADRVARVCWRMLRPR